MYVKKFEGDTLDGTLKDIKKELGPDAIILKTRTVKGLKGALGKGKIEITAAITEKNYVNKAKVDKVLPSELKEQFYSAPSSAIAKQIENHAEHSARGNQLNDGYGKIALNKAVRMENSAKLDDFLGDNLSLRDELRVNNQSEFNQESELSIKDQHQYESRIRQLEEVVATLLEQKTHATTQTTHLDLSEDAALEIRKHLLMLGFNSKLIQYLLKKAKFEMDPEGFNKEETLSEFVLAKLQDIVVVKMPKFTNVKAKPMLTILISQAASGQSSMCLKMCSTIKDQGVIIHFGKDTGNSVAVTDMTSSLLGIKMVKAHSLAQLAGLCREYIDQKFQVIVDFRNLGQDADQVVPFLAGLKRGFDDVEILLNLSLIHSEEYNFKQVEKYKKYINGINMSHFDLCLNFAHIFNLNYFYPEIPLMFFGVGARIPSDIRPADSKFLIQTLFDMD